MGNFAEVNLNKIEMKPALQISKKAFLTSVAITFSLLKTSDGIFDEPDSSDID